MHSPRVKTSSHRRWTLPVVILLFVAIAISSDRILRVTGLAADAKTQTPSHTALTQQPAIPAEFGKLPLSFAANQGQTDKRVRFLARGNGYSLFLTADEAVFALRSGTGDSVTGGNELPEPRNDRIERLASATKVLRMKLVDGNRNTRIEGLDKSTAKLNYFIGNNPRDWRTNIETYARVGYRNVYPGVDLIYHGNQQQLEYDFVVAPGASPQRIKLAFTGAQKISLDRNGDLILSAESGEVVQHKPVAYQETNGVRREVNVNYRIEKGKVRFELGAYDKSQTLVIDPVLVYSTYFGGASGETGTGIAVDAQGNTYITGNTFSTDFPTAGPFQGVKDAFNDAYISKLNPSGTALVYST